MNQQITEALDWLRGEIAAAADPVFQAGQQNYFKEGVKTIGLRTDHLHRIVRDLYKRVRAWAPADRNRLCTEMWKSGVLEEAGIVCHLYRRFSRQCGEAEFRLFEKWLDRYVTSWASCDGLSAWLLSACLANSPTLISELPAWTRSRNRWRRRAAAVSLLKEAHAGRNLHVILDIADRLAADRDDMVEKGIGWLLKETYPKQPDSVVEYLCQKPGRFSRLTLRYAAEKMTQTHRAAVLAR